MKNEILTILDDLIIQGQTFVGNDLVFIPDFEKSLTEEFKRKVYTANELAYCELFDDSITRYASTWAAKEAVIKATGTLLPISNANCVMLHFNVFFPCSALTLCRTAALTAAHFSFQACFWLAACPFAQRVS